MKLTVYFEQAFWYGLIEYTDDYGQYRVRRYLFGSEPKDVDIFHFIYQKMPALIEKNNRRMGESSALEAPIHEKKMNPKRMQREINKAKKKPVVSTKAQMELAKAHELLKKEKKSSKKKAKEERKEHQFQLKQEKRLEKKKGH